MNLPKKIVSADSYTFLLCLIAATLPLSIRLNSILTILLVGLWLLEGKWATKYVALSKNPWALLAITFFVLHLIGLSYTANIKNGIFDVEKKLPLLIFPLILGSTSFQKEIQTKTVIRFFILSCFLGSVYCFGHALYRYWNHIPTQLSVYGGFEATQAFKQQNTSVSPIWEYITYTELTLPLNIHPTYFAMYIAFIAIYILLNILRSVNLTRPIFWIRLALFMFFSVFLFILSSRIILIIFLGSLILAPAILFIKKISRLKILASIASIILISGLIIENVPIIRHRFTSDLSFFFKKKEDNNPGTGMFTRLHYWSAAASTIKSDPVIGVGTGDVQDTLDKHYTTYAKEHALGFNAHNQYLQTAVMLGFIGTISLVLLLAFALKYGFKHKNHNLIYLLILVSLVSMTEAILQVNKGIVFFSLFISILMFCAPAIEGYAQSEPE